ncbi:MAG: 3'(2'),5'-bisphosphate nucleotidase CysQ [Actinomycetota bacterium]|nr:3'(2'),5'-bisphosphate nucleotidase CysQ [Actinomycetota bacterium]
MTDRARIEAALDAAAAALEPFTPGAIVSRLKQGDDPVTAADLAVNAALHRELVGAGEGWLSEETVDDDDRVSRSRVWVVDPLDGTREFIAGIPEWCVSVGLVVDGVPVAGGVLNPATGHRIVGSLDEGVTLDGVRARCTATDQIEGALVLASRSEVKRGEWNRFFATPIAVRNMGSVAYKLACVGAGLADATWTLVPKHEWDVAAGAAIVVAGGGRVSGPQGEHITFNRTHPKLTGFVATAPALEAPVRKLLDEMRTG